MLISFSSYLHKLWINRSPENINVIFILSTNLRVLGDPNISLRLSLQLTLNHLFIFFVIFFLYTYKLKFYFDKLIFLKRTEKIRKSKLNLKRLKKYILNLFNGNKFL